MPTNLPLKEMTLADARGFRGHEITEIRRLVFENRKFFLEKWHEYFTEKK